ncbi:hypothetical protein LG274_00775 [Micrococcus antarcticus]|uniref:hypothetical protein n=1 Tax=Micrococcus antarcticus TaxID=86171 RepID=UPI0032628EE1
MPRPEIQHGLRRAARALPPDARARLRRAGGVVLRQLPTPVAQEIRGVFGVRWGTVGKREAEAARDALGLAGGSRGHTAPKGFAGRAAASVGSAPDAGDRLERALGTVDTGRSGAGHRTVVGLLAPDVRGRLEADGYRVLPLQPGTSVAVATRAEVVVIDLEAFTGVWAEALSTSGVSLLLELLAGIRAASRGGATCWLLVRGARRFEIGALLLQRHSSLMPIHPGRSRPAVHFTEDPGDASFGIADLLTSAEETAHA